jgi:dehydrogenase/reductase SDR family member 12
MTRATSIDTLLDRTILFGYGDVGFRIRRRLPHWPADPPPMDGAVVLVTGAGSGIGLAAARGFARLGASIRAVGRDQSRAEEAAAQITEVVPEATVRPLACDVSSTRAVRELSERLTAEEERLDVLVNNAGTMPDEREYSPEGHELMFATHVLAPFGLTHRLRGLLRRSAPARVINVSSGGMYGQRIPPDDFQSEQATYSAKKLYARTKREQVVISELWAGAGRRGRGRACDAPGLGRHQGRPRLAPRIPRPHRTDHPQPRGGSRHDRLAGRRPAGTRADRAVLARPPATANSLSVGSRR